MLKLVAVSALLCTLLCTASAEENAKIVKEIKLSKPFSTTIVDGSHLLTLSANRTHVFINSTDEHAKLCILAVDSEEHPIQKYVKATMVGDEVVVWGVRTRYRIDRKSRMDFTIIIVDPKQCSYQPVRTYEEEFLRFDVNKNLPEVVTHGSDSFDVFYSSVRGCSPCRYSVDGKRLDLKQSIEAEPLESSISTHVQTFDDSELKNGYFYAHNYDNKSSVIKLYDHDFNVVKEKALKHTTDTVAVSSGDHPTITTCYMTSTKKVNCERYDAKLESVFSTDLPLLEKHNPGSVSLAVDSSGDSFVSVVESADSEEIDVFRLYRLDPTGKVTKIIKLSEMPRKRYYGNWQLRGLISNKQYCTETTKIWTMWEHPSDADENESIKCIAI